MAAIALFMSLNRNSKISDLQDQVAILMDKVKSLVQAQQVQNDVLQDEKENLEDLGFDEFEVKKEPEIKIKKPVKTQSFEEKFAKKIPVWLGGICLALAGLFLVKYSHDAGILTNNIRVVLGALFGVLLIGFGEFAFSSEKFKSNLKISQSLFGAGLAVVYFALFSAIELYDLINVYLGFGLILGLIICSVLAALRYGMPIAIFSLGVMLFTPVLIDDLAGNFELLCAYVYLSVSAILFISYKKEQFRILSLISALGGIVMIAFVVGNIDNSQMAWPLFCLIGISLSIILSSTKSFDGDIKFELKLFKNPAFLLNIFAVGFNLALISLIVVDVNLNLFEWMVYAALMAGLLILSFFNSNYRYLPAFGLFLSFVMILSSPQLVSAELIIVAFAGVFVALSLLFVFIGRHSVYWAYFNAISVVGFYLIAYLRLKDSIEIEHFWSILALIIAACGVGLISFLTKILESGQVDDEKMAAERKLGIIGVCASCTMAAIGVAIAFGFGFLNVVLAFETLLLLFLGRYLKLAYLQKAALVVVIGLFLVITPFLLGFFMELALFKWIYLSPKVFTMFERYWLYFGFPVVALFISWFLFLPRLSGKIGCFLISFTLVLLAFVVQISVIDFAQEIGFNRYFVNDFYQRGIVNVMLILASLLICFVAIKKDDQIWLKMIKFLLFYVSARVIWFDLLFSVPFENTAHLGKLVLINNLMINYLAVAGLFVYFYVRIKPEISVNVKKFFMTLIAVMIFTYCSLVIRHAFENYFNQARSFAISSSELYAYSLLWLSMALSLMYFGAVKKIKNLRYVGIWLLILVILKVFFIDTANLDGGQRILSFFGLGISLIAVSYFYNKMVLEKK